MEAAIHATETMVLDYTVNGREQQPLGAGHPDYRPYGTYQCAARGEDDDRWIAITVTSEAELASLADVAGSALMDLVGGGTRSIPRSPPGHGLSKPRS